MSDNTDVQSSIQELKSSLLNDRRKLEALRADNDLAQQRLSVDLVAINTRESKVRTKMSSHQGLLDETKSMNGCLKTKESKVSWLNQKIESFDVATSDLKKQAANKNLCFHQSQCDVTSLVTSVVSHFFDEEDIPIKKEIHALKCQISSLEAKQTTQLGDEVSDQQIATIQSAIQSGLSEISKLNGELVQASETNAALNTKLRDDAAHN